MENVENKTENGLTRAQLFDITKIQIMEELKKDLLTWGKSRFWVGAVLAVALAAIGPAAMVNSIIGSRLDDRIAQAVDLTAQANTHIEKAETAVSDAVEAIREVIKAKSLAEQATVSATAALERAHESVVVLNEFEDKLKEIYRRLDGMKTLVNTGGVTSAVHKLIKEAGSESEELKVRLNAVQALGEVSAEPLIIGALISALGDLSEEVRDGAALSLQSHGEDAHAAAPALIELLRSEKISRVKAHAAYALGSIRASPKEVVLALVIALNDENPNVRGRAVDALGDFGIDAKRATTVLQRMVNAGDSESSKVKRALARINDPGG